MTRENVYRGGERKRIVTVKGSTVSDRNEVLPWIAINRSIRNCFHAFTPSPDFFEKYILLEQHPTARYCFQRISLSLIGLRWIHAGSVGQQMRWSIGLCESVRLFLSGVSNKMHAGKEKAPRDFLLRLLSVGCWTTRIRTWTNRTKTCCATITP